MSTGRTRGLLRGIVSIFTVNAIGLVLGLINSVILPKYLSIDTYAEIKTFQLYYNFVGVFHFGIIDAISLKYGGIKRKDIEQTGLKNELVSIRLLLVIEQLLLFLIGISFSDHIFIFIVFTITFTNIVGYYKILFQATGELKKYSNIVLWTSVLKCFVNILLIFILKSDNYLYFLIFYVCIDVLLCIYYEITEKIGFWGHNIRIIYTIKNGIMRGFPLLAGNLVVNLLSSIDRWFVKAGNNNIDFAFYSFAVSAEQILIGLTKPFQISLYNYFCVHKDDSNKIKILRKAISIFGSGLVGVFFVIVLFVEKYINKYIPSLTVLGILFLSQIWSIPINSVYINLYKANEMQKKYLWRVVIIVVVEIILDSIGFITYRKNITFAVTTLIVNILWFIISGYDFKNNKLELKEFAYLIIMSSAFVICMNIGRGLTMFVLYMLIFIIASVIVHKEAILWFISFYLKRNYRKG